MDTKVKAYICSPLSVETDQEIRKNMVYARQCMAEVAKEFGYRAYVPHAYLPELLDDHDPEERALALSFGISVLEHCHLLIICGSRISSGMEIEIKKAFQDQMAVFRYYPDNKQTLIPVKDWRQLDEMQIPVKDISE